MSLEIALQENTAAIRDLIALIGKGAATGVIAMPNGKDDKEKKSSPAPAASGAAQATPATSETSPASETSSAESAKTAETPTVEYAQVQKAVTNLVASKGRDKAIEVIKGLGVNNAKELAPEQWANALAVLEAAAK